MHRDRDAHGAMRYRGFTLKGTTTMLSLITTLLRQERGATAIEYAFIASLISIAIYATAVTVGSSLSSTFASVAASL